MAKGSKSSDKVTHYRDAVSGEYISKKKAEDNPNTSVKETDKKKESGKKTAKKNS